MEQITASPQVDPEAQELVDAILAIRQARLDANDARQLADQLYGSLMARPDLAAMELDSLKPEDLALHQQTAYDALRYAVALQQANEQTAAIGSLNGLSVQYLGRTMIATTRPDTPPNLQMSYHYRYGEPHPIRNQPPSVNARFHYIDSDLIVHGSAVGWQDKLSGLTFRVPLLHMGVCPPVDIRFVQQHD
jgi:hypothetical protein